MRLGRILSALRRPTVIVGAIFLVLAGSIFGNALFLQGGRHPAPLFAPGSDGGANGGRAVRRDTLVEAVQAALGERGLYTGPVDGVPGPQTASAILAFEAEAGLQPTGKATAPLLAAILKPPPQADPAPVADPAPAQAGLSEPVNVGSLGQDRVAAVQGALSRAAYGQITPDGVMGPQTRDAIRRFQADHGLPLTGTISDALMVELRAAGALEGD